jgi:uncharacterized membrane protein required for colicin V production
MAGLLVAGMVLGYRRGFIKQTVSFLGLIVALVVAFRFRGEFEPFVREWIPFPFSGKKAEWVWLTVFNIETVYYSALAFALLFLIIKLAISLVARLLDAVSRLPGLNLANKSLGMIVGILKMGLILFIISHILFFLPWETGQALLYDSKLGLWMVNNSPFVSVLEG